MTLNNDGEYDPDSNISTTPVPWVISGAVLDEAYNTPRKLTDHIETSLSKGDFRYFEKFKGTFSGAHWNSVVGGWLAYTNQLGDSQVFYFHENGKFAFGSDLGQVQGLLSRWSGRQGVRLSAAYSMLTYGYLLPGETINDRIRRLKPGEVATVGSDGTIRTDAYHVWKRPPVQPLSLGDAAEEVDRLFRGAVERAFSHDVDRGRAHLADLSGGMDARMVNWVARDLGFQPITNITYSQSNFRGQKIAQQLALRLGNQLFSGSLDGGGFLLDADAVVSQNYGLGLYAGITGGRRVLEALNWAKFGLEHTGQLGDALVGSSYMRPGGGAPWDVAGYYSSRLLHKLDQRHVAEYEDREMYLFHVRGLSGILSTHPTRQHYTQPVSPFLDPDLVSFCHSLPEGVRERNRLYRYWVTTKYPSIASVANDNTGVPITAGDLRTFVARALRAVPNRASKVLPKGSKTISASSMNPFQYWYETNPAVSEYLDARGSGEILEKVSDRELPKDIDWLLRKGTPLEKTMAITVISSIQRFVDV